MLKIIIKNFINSFISIITHIFIDMKEFIKWFFDTQVSKRKIPIYREFFMNAIALGLIVIYGLQLINDIKVSSEFMMLLSMVLGFYFNNKQNDKIDD